VARMQTILNRSVVAPTTVPPGAVSTGPSCCHTASPASRRSFRTASRQHVNYPKAVVNPRRKVANTLDLRRLTHDTPLAYRLPHAACPAESGAPDGSAIETRQHDRAEAANAATRCRRSGPNIFTAPLSGLSNRNNIGSLKPRSHQTYGTLRLAAGPLCRPSHPRLPMPGCRAISYPLMGRP
jgi:hypothetical protein